MNGPVILNDVHDAYILILLFRKTLRMHVFHSSFLIFLVAGVFSTEEPPTAVSFRSAESVEHTPYATWGASHRLRSAKADTIDAGHLFVVNLPDSIRGIPADGYFAKELPLHSWLLKKSFFWRTRDEDKGDHALTFYVFRVDPDDTTEKAPQDSVNVNVTIR